MRFKLFNRLIPFLAWGYFAGLTTGVLLFHLFGNDGWLSIAMLYGPRWLWAIPALVLLLPVLAKSRRRLLVPLGLSFILVAWPIMGLCLPWSALGKGGPGEFQLRILSCNCNGHAISVSSLKDVVNQTSPDIVALQESKELTAQELASLDGWHMHHDSGLTLLSRHPILTTHTYWSRSSPWPVVRAVRYGLQTESGLTEFFNIHLETPREGLQALVDREPEAIQTIEHETTLRREEADAIALWINEVSGPKVVAGDFNLPVESAIYRNSFGTYQNAFSTAGWGWGYTKFTRWHGIRIDHILADGAWRIDRCWIGADVSSDHRPIIADVSLANR